MRRILLLSVALMLVNALIGQHRLTFNHQIFSKSLSESRSITVSLPTEYNSRNSSFGVLYVLDGEYVFEYAEGAVSFLSNAFGYVPPLIVVSIPNIDRGRDMNVRFDDTDRYENFLAFIENELMPFVNRTYRTTGFDLLYGWSSASNINIQMLARNPNLFDAHIQSGTGVGNKTENFLTEYLKSNEYVNVFLYANVEGSGPRLQGLERYKSLIHSIQPNGLKYKFEVMTSSSHVNVLADGIYHGLQFVFEDFYIPDSVSVKGLDSIKTYYAALDNKYSFDVKIPVGGFVESAGVLFQHNKTDEAIRLLEFGIELYPKSTDIIGSLGEVYEYMEDYNSAAKYYLLAHEASLGNSIAKQKYLHLSDQMRTKKSPKK